MFKEVRRLNTKRYLFERTVITKAGTWFYNFVIAVILVTI